MHPNRIDNPKQIVPEEVTALLDEYPCVIVQYSKARYSKQDLELLNSLCKKHGSRLQIRFYSHDCDKFDASVLSRLHEVRSLSIDCLDAIKNEDAFSQLPHLQELSLGVYKFDRPDILDILPLEQLSELNIGRTKKQNFDLAPLTRCKSIERLSIEGHSKNIEVLTGLKTVEKLNLRSIPKKQSLKFVNDMKSLKTLYLSLGSRETIQEISHSTLQELGLIRVRGLADLGPLERFTALQRLNISDQLQIKEMSLSGLNLYDLCLTVCKNLTKINGLEEQTNLKSILIRETKLDLDELLNHNWPSSMETVALSSGSTKWNKMAEEKLKQRGYSSSLKRFWAQ